MRADELLAVPARMDALGEAIAFVEAFCGRCGVAASDVLRLSLVVEELFTNTVVHGHGGGSDAPVRIALGADPACLHLCFEDTAAAFDLLAHVARSPLDPAAGVADRPVGQLGIALVVRMAERIDYEHDDGCNRVRLSLRRQGA